jgi:hypothetical protein
MSQARFVYPSGKGRKIEATAFRGIFVIQQLIAPFPYLCLESPMESLSGGSSRLFLLGEDDRGGEADRREVPFKRKGGGPQNRRGSIPDPGVGIW